VSFQAGTHVEKRPDAHDFSIQAKDDVGWGVGARHQSEPGIDDEV
jgi:hypothetical protein